MFVFSDLWIILCMLKTFFLICESFFAGLRNIFSLNILPKTVQYSSYWGRECLYCAGKCFYPYNATTIKRNTGHAVGRAKRAPHWGVQSRFCVIIDERAKRARHSQVCSIENHGYILYIYYIYIVRANFVLITRKEGGA